MNRTGANARGNVAAVVVAAAAAIVVSGCAAPGSAVSSESGVSTLPSSIAASSASPAPASSADVVGLGPPACPFAQFQLILGPHALSVWTTPTLHKPFSDVGVSFGPQLPGATVVWARLDVVVTDDTPLIPDPANPSGYGASEAARPDSFEKLMAGTDPHVARVTLKPFAQGPFVLPAAVLNALPAGVSSYTVYLVESIDESACFGVTYPPTSLGSGDSVIAELAP